MRFLWLRTRVWTLTQQSKQQEAIVSSPINLDLYQLLLAIIMFYADSTGNRIAYTFPFMESDKISY